MFKLGKKKGIAVAFTLALLFALLAAISGYGVEINFPEGKTIGPEGGSPAPTIGPEDAVPIIIIGPQEADAAGVADYTCDGTDDHIQIQAAMDALPALGGKLVILAGDYSFSAIVSRAIDNVTIEGMGASTYFANNGETVLFSAGSQDGWLFSSLATDAGGLDVASATNSYLEGCFVNGELISTEQGLSAGTRVYRTVAQSIPDGILTYVEFDAERYDTDNIHEGVSYPERLTCRTAGVYIITASIGFDTNAVGSRMAEIHHSGLGKNIVTGRTPAYAAVYTHLTITTVHYLAVDDYIRLRVMQDSGDALDLMAFPNCSEFAMQRIG